MAYARIPPLVMTLGMIGVVQGLILLYTGGTAAGRTAPIMISVVKGDTVLGIPGLLWIWLLLGTETVFLNLADQYMLPSIAAVVIGGDDPRRRVGGDAGTAVGAVVLTVLQSLLTTIRMDEAQRQIVLGTVLIVLLSSYGRQRRLRQ